MQTFKGLPHILIPVNQIDFGRGALIGRPTTLFLPCADIFTLQRKTGENTGIIRSDRPKADGEDRSTGDNDRSFQSAPLLDYMAPTIEINIRLGRKITQLRSLVRLNCYLHANRLITQMPVRGSQPEINQFIKYIYPTGLTVSSHIDCSLLVIPFGVAFSWV